MKVVFRADASTQIGTGHVMRCLTLADALTAKGARCEFICREHPGHLSEYIRSKGYAVHNLHLEKDRDADLLHSPWLGATQRQDGQGCQAILTRVQPDWLVVDHYALDARWESALAAYCGKIMVIDDLADRPHNCKLLLDQNFGRNAEDYRLLVPSNCTLLCGASFALLRPEFAALRPYSLERRAHPKLKRLLISMGGVDKDNITTQVLSALRTSVMPSDTEITVVMGATAPWSADVQELALTMPWSTIVRVGVSDMAQLMADSDLAIGAAGSTTWERCCLGLPTIMLVSAVNQTHVADIIAKSGAARVLDIHADLKHKLPNLLSEFTNTSAGFTQMCRDASVIVDGCGSNAVVSQLGM